MLELPAPDLAPRACLSPAGRAVLEDRLATAGLTVWGRREPGGDVHLDGDLPF